VSKRTRPTPRLFAAVMVVLALVVAACGGGGTKKTTAATKPARRIVSLSATATEMLYAIGAGKQVVAVDDTSNYPANAPKTKLNALNPNVEAVAAYKPDLVVASDDTGGLFDGLKRLSIAALLQPAAKTLDDSYAQIQQLGRATGHESGAADVVSKMRGRIASLVAEVPKRATQPTYYDEIDNTLYSVTSDTFIGQIFKLAGLRDIADATQDKAGGYPQLSAEFVVQSKPDYIFLTDAKCCGQSESTVAGRPGWGDLPAVKQHHVVTLDDDVASRWGPRVPDFLKTVVDATKGT
jgi:iron complex transport system substrate-binding protein